jgi:hypothetical protein
MDCRRDTPSGFSWYKTRICLICVMYVQVDIFRRPNDQLNAYLPMITSESLRLTGSCPDTGKTP